MRPTSLRNTIFYITTSFLVSLISCNLSDDTEKLPGGHTYVNEGRCYKFILVNIKGGPNIESCVSEYKYDDNFITAAQIDEVKCDHSAPFNKEDRKFFIIDNNNERLLGPFSHADFQIQFDKLQVSKKLFIE